MADISSALEKIIEQIAPQFEGELSVRHDSFTYNNACFTSYLGRIRETHYDIVEERPAKLFGFLPYTKRRNVISIMQKSWSSLGCGTSGEISVTCHDERAKESLKEHLPEYRIGHVTLV